jgi:hypothetical protein
VQRIPDRLRLNDRAGAVIEKLNLDAHVMPP